MEGKLHQMRGKVKQVAGKLSDNPKLEAKGPLRGCPVSLRKRSVRSRKYLENSFSGVSCSGDFLCCDCV